MVPCNYQPVPTFQTVENFNMIQFYKCVASKQCLLQVNTLHSQQDGFVELHFAEKS